MKEIATELGPSRRKRSGNPGGPRQAARLPLTENSAWWPQSPHSKPNPGDQEISHAGLDVIAHNGIYLRFPFLAIEDTVMADARLQVMGLHIGTQTRT